MNKQAQEIAEYALDKLCPSLLCKSGSFIFSSAETLKKGDIYFLGTNPGGNPEDEDKSLKGEIKDFPNRTSNAFLDECWRSECKYSDNPSKCDLKNENNCEKGNHLIQKRVKKLLESLGLVVEETCYSNLIFERTKDTSKLDIKEEAEKYWCVHEEIIKVIQPKLILVHGVTTRFFFEKIGFTQTSRKPSGYSNWKWCKYEGKVNEKKIELVIFPHLSRYGPQCYKEGQDLVKEIKRIIS